MAEVTASAEDPLMIKQILLDHKAEGVDRPFLPMNVDIDGDGITYAWGLDTNDEVVVVSGVDLKDTVYISDGDDIRDHPDAG